MDAPGMEQLQHGAVAGTAWLGSGPGLGRAVASEQPWPGQRELLWSGTTMLENYRGRHWKVASPSAAVFGMNGRGLSRFRF